MRATEKDYSMGLKNRLLVDSAELQILLGTGRPTAVKVGTDAGARVQIGHRVLWNVQKIQKYLDTISGKEQEDEQQVSGFEGETAERI